jgi:hypothetical protein
MSEKFTPPGQDPFTLGTSATATGSGIIAKWPSEIPFEYWLKTNIREFDVTLNLPKELHIWIGKITTYWAIAEWIQAGTLARLLNIGRKEARVMFGDRIGNCISKIKQNMEIKDIPLPDNFSTLSKTLNECELSRNLLGHGVWMVDPDTNELCVQNPSGEWLQQLPRISKRKYPEAVYPDEQWLSSALDKIKKGIRDVQELDRLLDSALPPSPRKS